MIKLLTSLIFLFIFTVSWSQENADSAKSKFEAAATISLNSNITLLPGSNGMRDWLIQYKTS